jgi:Ca-activated chloride channel family protein
MVSAAQDPVSTFSLDTDRASYQRSLELAQSGYDIDPVDVRAEEWINSLGYGYPQPTRADEFAIHTDVFQHPDTQGMHMARIGIQAPDTQGYRRPVNVTLALDSSGSMRDGNRVKVAREAAYAIIGNLESQDLVAILHFEEDVIRRHLVEHTNPSDNDVWKSIDSLDPGGATNVQAGLDRALEMAYDARARNPESINYVILFSDGVANVDATNPFAILHNLGEASEYSRPNPIRIITIGVGITGYNDELLEQLAQHGNGWYRYLDNTDQARTTFSRENWLALAVPFADQARAQVTWDPDVVQSWRLIGYENRIAPDHQFAQNRKEFAEIPSGAATTVFYELELADSVALRGWDDVQLGGVELRWVTPGDAQSMQQHAAIQGRSDSNFVDLDDSLLRLGALVALSSDRYSSLPYVNDPNAPSVHRQLSTLVDHLQPLESDLGKLEAYQDFSFLLEHITRYTPREERTPGNSGYSR